MARGASAGEQVNSPPATRLVLGRRLGSVTSHPVVVRSLLSASRMCYNVRFSAG